ncbi:MAG TPA: HAD hydrolase-like protein, partial [Sphingomonadales bacterium]|nr:HAD hydrolase-like protein [Sphingomonadales bacterium]
KTLAAGRTLVCANPDKVVPVGSSQVYCAGAIAERYEAEGGKVIWLGKPEAAAYEACLVQFRKGLGREVSISDVLAIGDNLETDIKGAVRLGMTSVFISEGLHGHHMAAELDAVIAQIGIQPDYIMARLKG